MPRKCKEARRAYKKAYYQANKEKIKAYREANREKIKAWRKAYREANKERILAKEKAYSRAYRKGNREKVNAIKARQRALKRKQIPKQVRDCPTEKERLRQIYKLSDVFTKATGVQHHVDHMWPLSKKGPHWSGNLQIITAIKNMKKSAKLNKDIKATIREMLKDIKDAY